MINSRLKLHLLLLLTFGATFVLSGKAADVLKVLKSRLKNGGKNLEVCNLAVQNGKNGKQEASAKNGVSPLKQFGFPSFVLEGKKVKLVAGVPLSFLEGHFQPIKLGSRDYVFAGTSAELLAFTECFKDYDVIGSALAPDGHWKPGTGTLKIQMQNANTDSQGQHSEMWEIVFKISLDSIVAILGPKTLSATATETLTGLKHLATATDLLEFLQTAKQYLPNPAKYFKKIEEVIKATKMAKEDKVKEVQKMAEQVEKENKLPKGSWSSKNVDKGKKIVVTLTMYEKPDNAVRTTYDMGKAQMKVSDIGEALAEYLKG